MKNSDEEISIGDGRVKSPAKTREFPKEKKLGVAPKGNYYIAAHHYGTHPNRRKRPDHFHF
jgi:hypothetical protein